MADEGLVDGEMSRVYSYNEKHPNLVRVEEPHISGKFIAITTNPSVRISGWEDLDNSEFKVEYTMGMKGSEDHLPRIVGKENLSSVVSPVMGLRKLLVGRTDVVVDFDMSIMGVLKSPRFINSEVYVSGIMEEVAIHSFLHKRMAFLARNWQAF